MKKALVLDRDGVICEALPRGEYLVSLEQLRLLEGIQELLEEGRRRGYVIVVATNQPQIGKGLLAESELHRIHAEMRRRVGGHIDGIYYCPHTASAGCVCRKPRPGLLLQAAAELELDPRQALFVGDSDKDVLAGRAWGCRTVFMKNSMNAAELERCAPDRTVMQLSELLEELR